MIAHADPVCRHPNRKKHGTTATGCQRFRCKDCGQTITEKTTALEGMRIDLDRVATIVKCLVDGMGVRATGRITDTDHHTIMDLLVLIGDRCKRFLEAKCVSLIVNDVEVDELWSFVRCKEKTRQMRMLPLATFGDQYCFVGLEANTKLILAWHLGNRELGSGRRFIEKLARACATTGFHIATDGWTNYKTLIRGHMASHNVQYTALIKLYGTASQTTRYSPAPIMSVKRKPVIGSPDLKRACTSHIERQNLSIRMGLRRFTRLTNAFSKKFENHEAAIGLYFAYYNFCMKQTALKTTPAVAAKLTDHVWTARELIEATMGY
jgi:IS1 family transposase/transposase-like protein